jgi:hypothetical protein
VKRNIVGILTLATSITFIVFVWILLSSIKNPEPDAAVLQKIFNLPLDEFRPELRERTQYIAGVILFPVICALIFLTFNYLVFRLKGNVKYTQLIISVSAVALVVLLAAAGLRNVDNNYLLPSSLFRAPFLAISFCTIAFVGMLRSQYYQHENNSTKGLFTTSYFFLGACVILLIVIETIFNENEYWASQTHFIAFFDSVVQTYLGKTPLVDLNTQYGLYPVFLKPVLQLTGLSVVKFTVVMGLLKGIAFASLLLLLWKTVKNKAIAFFGFASIAFYLRLRMPVDTSTDPYFQYVPLRFLFPTVFIFLAWLYIAEKKDGRKKLLYYFINLFCAIAVLWNTDTGLIVLLTWIATLLYQEWLIFRTRKLSATFIISILHILTAMGTLTLVVMGYCLYAFTASGFWPDIQNSFAYTNLFYFYGYFMVPIPQAIHPWNMVVLIYMVALFISIRHFFEVNNLTPLQVNGKKNQSELTTLIFSLSILGVGLLNYYVGRSQDIYLVWPTWPILILLTYFADNIFSDFIRIFRRKSLPLASRMVFSPRWMYKVFLFLIVFSFLASSILSIASYFSIYRALIASRMSGISAGIPDRVRQGIELIQSKTHKGDKVLILSDFAPELYLYTNRTRPLVVPGFGELALNDDIKKITGFLASPPDNAFVYWDTRFSIITPTQFENLIPIAYSENKDLILYMDKQNQGQ